MGRILLYLACGYVALVILSSALFTGPVGLPLVIVVVAAFLVYRRRSGQTPRLVGGTEFRLLLGAPAALDDSPLDDAVRHARRLDEARARLDPALPEDPLENRALVDVLAAYLHEPPEVRASVEDEYRTRRGQYLAWRQRVEALGSPEGLTGSALAAWIRSAKELDGERGAVDAYIAELHRRADAAGGLLDEALERSTRAGEHVAAARAAATSVADASSARLLLERVELAESKQREAWEALEEGKERPLSSIRVADEATALADEVKERAAKIAALPAEARRRVAELDVSIDRAQTELDRVQEEFDNAATSYAPSSWHELGGVGHAARRSIERARRLRESAALLVESGHADDLERAEREADEARGALDDASRLRGAIERHLAKLETAAVGGRELVLRAEQEIDRAWAVVHEHKGRCAGNEVLHRAAELVQQARDGLAAPQPDWLGIADLADRGTRLARDVIADRAAPATDLESPRVSLAEAKARAKYSRDSAWAVAIVRPATAAAASSLLEAAEDAYQAALRAEASLGDAPNEATVTTALAAFADAERAAAEFSTAAEEVDGTRADSALNDEGHVAHTLVWDLKLTRALRL